MKLSNIVFTIACVLIPFSLSATPFVTIDHEGKQLECVSGEYGVKVITKGDQIRVIPNEKRIARIQRRLKSKRSSMSTALKRKLRKKIKGFKKHDEACRGGYTILEDFQRSFQATFFDTSNPGKIIYKAKVKEIAVSYAFDQGDGFSIDSENFDARWVGTVSFNNQTTRAIHISQSWAQTKLYIDDKLIFNDDTEGIVTHTFSPGEHKVEVLYRNNWHTTNFFVRFLTPRTELTLDEVSAKLTSPLQQNPLILYGGVYDNATSNGATSVQLQPTDRPVVLLLSSYGPIQWNITEAHKGQLLAVIVSSSSVGSYVRKIPTGVPVHYSQHQHFPAVHELIPSCSEEEFNGTIIFYCESDPNGFLTLAENVETISGGRRLDGFAGQYNPETLPVPGEFFDDARYQDVLSTLKALSAKLPGF